MELKHHQRIIFVSLFIGTAIYLYNRKCITLAIPKLLETRITVQDAGTIASSQNLAFSISKFFGGIFSDRLSARFLNAGGLIVAGAATVLFANVDSVWLFSLLWFVNGFGQGVGWPACVKLMRQWFAPSQLGKCWSVLSSSQNIAGAVSPVISTFLIINYGWKASVILNGLISIVIGMGLLALLKNSPEDVGFQAFINEKPKASNKTKEFKNNTLAILLRSPFLWLIAFGNDLVIVCMRTTITDWGQLYLMNEKRLSLYAAINLTSSFEVGGFFGRICGGFLTDLLTKYNNPDSNSNPRLKVAIIFVTINSAALHCLCFHIESSSSELWISVLGFTLGLCIYGCIPIFGVVSTESVPIYLSGTSYDIVGLGANIGSIIAGLPVSMLSSTYDWSFVFKLLEVISIGTVILMIAARNAQMPIKKLVPKKKKRN